jgi:cytochrome P450
MYFHGRFVADCAKRGSPNMQAGWTEWQRMRKIVAAPFNENTNKLVWSESLDQTRDMIAAWTQYGQAGTQGLAKDTRTLSLDVLAATGFRKSYKFRSSTELGADEARSYRGSLAITLDNALFMMLVPPRILSLPFVPKTWKRVGQATKDFRQYMMDMFNEERRLLNAGKPGTGNLMSSLVRVSEDEQKEDVKDGATGLKGLTMNEILGNIFVINFAGHDTTANTLAYSMLLLAAYPEVQQWVGEELKEVVHDSSSETWKYGELFPRLKRCQAVLVSAKGQTLVPK